MTRIPRLDNNAVHAYYHACDVFVNLNDREIFGMSLLEAMYAGCPPVARHAPGPDLIIENGVSGILCDTVDQLAAGVRQVTMHLYPEARHEILNDCWRETVYHDLRLWLEEQLKGAAVS